MSSSHHPMSLDNRKKGQKEEQMEEEMEDQMAGKKDMWQGKMNVNLQICLLLH